VKREPRLERLTVAARHLRRRLRELPREELLQVRDVLERVLEEEVLDRDALRKLEEHLLR
jgi:hypothetical protein